MANWDFGGLNWSDSPILAGGNAGEAGNESYVDPFQLSQLDYAQLGYGGPIDYGSGGGTENGDAYGANNDPMNNPGIANWMKQNNYHLGNAYAPGAAPIGYTGLFGQDNKLVGSPIMRNYDDTEFGLAMQLAGSVMGTAGLDMAGWGSGFGGGFAGNAVKGATLGSIGSGLGGGNPFTGAAIGALSGGSMGGLKEAGYAPSQLAGVNNPIVSNMLDNSASAGVRAGLTGQNPWQAAAMAGATTGLNGLGKMYADNLNSNNTGGNMTELPWNDNPAMNASYPTGGYQPPGAQALSGTGLMPEMSYAAPGSPVYGDTFNYLNGNQSAQNPQDTRERASSAGPGINFNLPSMGQVGNFALNNAGDLAGMLYGYLNNRKQQRQLGDMMGGLKGLYSPNSPYAQQLRQQLDRRDAAAGRRSQYGPREVELQAKLAGMASNQIPAMYQMQMGQNQLQNQNMNMLFQGINRMGGFKGLANMFGGGGGPQQVPMSQPLQNYYNSLNSYDPNQWGG